MELLELFFVFVKIGSISFGGGYAMIPFLQYEVVSRGWLTEAEIADMIGMSQITPGPIATNMATFVGYSEYGLIGAIVATVGVTLPALILAIVVSKYIITKLKDDVREGIFFGLQPVVIGLILCSCITLAMNLFFPGGLQDFNIASTMISVVSLILLVKYKISSIKLIAMASIIGIILL